MQKDIRSFGQKGFSLVESFIAISILIVGILASLTVVLKSLGSVSLISDRLTAAQLSQEGIELVENIRENNWLNGCGWNASIPTSPPSYEIDNRYQFNLPCDGVYLTSYNDTPLNFDSTTGRYSYAAGAASKFKRRIEITQISANEIRVNSIVEWAGRGGVSFDINVEKHLFNYL